MPSRTVSTSGRAARRRRASSAGLFLGRGVGAVDRGDLVVAEGQGAGLVEGGIAHGADGARGEESGLAQDAVGEGDRAGDVGDGVVTEDEQRIALRAGGRGQLVDLRDEFANRGLDLGVARAVALQLVVEGGEIDEHQLGGVAAGDACGQGGGDAAADLRVG